MPEVIFGIAALAVFDDGSGESLFVGGNIIEAGTLPVRHIARWDGTQWHDVGGGMNSAVFALTVFDDGTGPALYAGGRFTEAGAVPASNIARWDGKAWSALGAGTNAAVRALTVWDRDAAGPEPAGLYVGGEFTMAGGFAAPRIAKWAGCNSCYADCDTTTGPRNLDIFDFLCFQNAYAAGCP